MTIYYPDVSHWRKGLNLSGAIAVCAKVTESTDYFDDTYAGFKDQASKVGAFFFAFHFLRHGNAAAQARYCYSKNGKVPLMLDIERRYDPANGIDSRPTLADTCEFIDEYRQAGGICNLVYLPHWYWQDYMKSVSLQPLRDRHMWLVSSNYTTYSDSGPGWASYGGMTPKIWQYTSTKSFGGQATVDFNAYKGTVQQLQSLAAKGKETMDVGTVCRLTETGGWVNGVTHHKTSKHNDGMQVPSAVMGVVMHTMVGYLSGTDNIFMNGPIQSSAHFGIGVDGTIIQWVSIRGGVAWHCCDGNYSWYGIEHEDKGHPETPLTEAQINASAQLFELLSRDNVGRFAMDVVSDIRHEGYACHYMGGAAWGGHTCPDNFPGKGPRSGQRAEIVRRAKIIRATGQYPAPSTTPPKPVGVLSVSPASGIAPLTVKADGSKSTQQGGHIDDWQFTFGDGSAVAKGKSGQSHVYSKPGTYTVTLVVFGSLGRQHTVTATVKVVAPPVNTLVVTPTEGRIPLTITADASTSAQEDGSITNWQFGWGDGSGLFNGTESVRQYTYAKSGSYTVVCRVTGSFGGVTEVKAPVVVTAEYVADGTLAIAEISALLGLAPNVLIAKTVLHYGGFDPMLAGYIDGLADGSVLPPVVPAGAKFWYE